MKKKICSAATVGLLLLSGVAWGQTLPPTEGSNCVRYWAAVFAHPESSGLRFDAQRYENFQRDFPGVDRVGFVSYQCNTSEGPTRLILNEETRNIAIFDQTKARVVHEPLH